jgi:signal transduction histidine kinase
MHDSLRWVLHTYEARGEIRQVRISTIDLSGRIATASAINDPHFLQGLPGDFLGQSASISSLRGLTRDSPSQQARLTQLKSLLADLQSKFGTCESSLRCLPDSAVARQTLLRSAWNERETMLTILDAMENDEDGLLRQRLAGWSSHYRLMVLVLILCFVSAVILIFFNLRLLRTEAERRSQSERMIREHIDSYRALSGRILELQDAERRKIARELHDSVSQYLAGVRLQLQQLERLPSDSMSAKRLFVETTDLLDHALTEVRTISHLLHPPLLDELGLYSAARWYIEGFAKRSGIDVSFSLDDFRGRLPRDTELAFFRVLQEALTNVHRHSRAKCVQIDLSCSDDVAVLRVRDDGHGIPARVLRRFQDGHGGGIGLAGMRERLADLQGQLSVESTARGTVITATVPTNSFVVVAMEPTGQPVN